MAPILISFGYSLTNYNPFNPPVKFVGLDNYRLLVHRRTIPHRIEGHHDPDADRGDRAERAGPRRRVAAGPERLAVQRFAQRVLHAGDPQLGGRLDRLVPAARRPGSAEHPAAVLGGRAPAGLAVRSGYRAVLGGVDRELADAGVLRRRLPRRTAGRSDGTAGGRRDRRRRPAAAVPRGHLAAARAVADDQHGRAADLGVQDLRLRQGDHQRRPGFRGHRDDRVRRPADRVRLEPRRLRVGDGGADAGDRRGRDDRRAATSCAAGRWTCDALVAAAHRSRSSSARCSSCRCTWCWRTWSSAAT